MHGNNLVGAQMRQTPTLAATGQRPQSEVDSEMEFLTRALHEASDIVGNLLDRISPVLIPEPLNTASGVQSGVPEAVMSPLADQVRSQRRRVEALTERVRGAANRLAL